MIQFIKRSGIAMQSLCRFHKMFVCFSRYLTDHTFIFYPSDINKFSKELEHAINDVNNVAYKWIVYRYINRNATKIEEQLKKDKLALPSEYDFICCAREMCKFKIKKSQNKFDAELLSIIFYSLIHDYNEIKNESLITQKIKSNQIRDLNHEKYLSNSIITIVGLIDLIPIVTVEACINRFNMGQIDKTIPTSRQLTNYYIYMNREEMHNKSFEFIQMIIDDFQQANKNGSIPIFIDFLSIFISISDVCKYDLDEFRSCTISICEFEIYKLKHELYPNQENIEKIKILSVIALSIMHESGSIEKLIESENFEYI